MWQTSKVPILYITLQEARNKFYYFYYVGFLFVRRTKHDSIIEEAYICP